MNQLKAKSIYHSEEKILDKPSVIGYEKKFKWIWFATQLHTFIVVSDYANEEITKTLIEKHLNESFKYAQQSYKGWPKGFQSGIGVISILISNKIDEESKKYCLKLKSGKKWSAFTIPVVIDSETKKIYSFKRIPIWGGIYYPHFKKIINYLK